MFFKRQLNEFLVDRNDFEVSILHLNARSLSGNFETFNQLLGLLNHEFSAIGISETWLNDSNSVLADIRGYLTFSKIVG